MDFFWEMLSLQETLFLLILLGVLVKKLKIIRENGRKTLSDLLIYAILPCNIVASFMGGITLPDGFVHNCILAVCISIGIQVLSIYGSKLLFRRYPANQKSVLSYGMICSNSSFVGLPIAHLMFGDLGVIYTSVFQIPLRFTMWTAGLSLFTDVSKKDAFRKLVRHPCIIAVFVGLILMVAPISLPNFLEEAIDITSGCTVPLSMIVIGTILADAPNPISILQIRAMVHLFTVGVLSRADLAGAKAVPAGFNAGQCLHSDNGDARRQHDFHFGRQIRR